jgi:hypothetical protein
MSNTLWTSVCVFVCKAHLDFQGNKFIAVIMPKGSQLVEVGKIQEDCQSADALGTSALHAGSL